MLNLVPGTLDGHYLARKSLLVLFFLSTLQLAGEVPVSPETTPLFSSSEFTGRRERVLESLKRESPEGAVLFIRSPRARSYSNDIDYPYRADNDLYYLTGLANPGVALILSTEEIEGLGNTVLFVWPEAVPEEVLWTGPRPGPDDAARISGVARESVLETDTIPETLRTALGLSRRHGIPHAHHPPSHTKQSGATLYFDTGAAFDPGKSLSPGYAFLIDTFGSAAFHLGLQSTANIIAPFRQIKSPAEISAIKKACSATCRGLKRAATLLRAGIHEYDLAASLEATFRREGASGWSFPSIVGSGPNSCILHYQKYDRRLQDGDLVLMDVGAEYELYAADITRTFPVNGKFSPRQREIYDIVLKAQQTAIDILRPGLPFKSVHETAKNVIAGELVRIGLIESEVEVRTYYPHGTSHLLGLDVHDVMPIKELQAGMVITVEPGIYIPEENLGIRIEDDLLITEDGYQSLSTGAPRSADEIEAWMRTGSF